MNYALNVGQNSCWFWCVQTGRYHSNKTMLNSVKNDLKRTITDL